MTPLEAGAQLLQHPWWAMAVLVLLAAAAWWRFFGRRK
jgi:hypothetical protein